MKLRSYVKNFLLEDSISDTRIAPEKPLRAQVYTRDQLAELAGVLAEQEIAVSAEGKSVELRSRFNENCKILADAYFTLAEAAREKEPLSPGAEWLLDNFHIVEQHIRDIKKFFPSGYDRTLPKFRSGEWSGFPRVYRLALEVVTHSDALIDTDLLSAFINSYQSKRALTSGELWAVPIMLKFALIENLRRLIGAIIDSRNERLLADHALEEIFTEHDQSGADILLTFARKVEERTALLEVRSGHLVRKLRERGTKAMIALQWLESKLHERGLVPDQLIRDDYQRQALDQISIGNSITSLKSIGAIDWSKWFEAMSKVDALLRGDPSKVYSASDFPSRDLFRHNIEQLSRWGKVSELTICEKVVETAKKSSGIASHIGYHLTGAGRESFEKSLKISPPFRYKLGRFCKNSALSLYLGAISTLTFLFLIAALLYSYKHGGGVWATILITLFFTLPASDLASNIIQWCVTHIVPTTLLPKFELKEGIPDEFRTLVVVHGIFEDPNSLDKVIDLLEVRSLANPENNLYFGLLADLKDSQTETSPVDSELMKRGEELIKQLNEKYPQKGDPRFFILFRKRQFNPCEGVWMAWERKRGKLEELNNLILGKDQGSFIITPELRKLFKSIRYVITLDGDSQLPKDAARKLVGTISHPLNISYGIIQPRVGVSLTSANKSQFAKIFSGHSGLDPYTQTVSDVYQDLFGEASYVGKGIYDVRTFDKALHDKIPQNALLSHDLLEGIYAKCGLASDIELLDEFPSRYVAYSKRQHRWVRGDWQTLPWIGRTDVSAIGKWKLIDNLRRSLLGPSLTVFLLLAWTVLPGSALVWCILAVLGVAFPIYTNLASVFIIPPIGLSLSIYIRGLGHDLLRQSQQAILAFTFLAHHSWLMCHAIVITLKRIFITKMHLLEWETAYQAERRSANSLIYNFSSMYQAPLIALFSALAVYALNPSNAVYALPFIAAWLLSPFIATGLGNAPQTDERPLSQKDREYLKRIAFDTWKYFRDNATEEHNYLIPDNVQFVPQKAVAARTSPTNIGLSLLSYITAYDFGFITVQEALDRIEKTFISLAKLERFRGHFLNWYETTTLTSLRPRYVSSVDSGNFIGYLFAVRQAAKEFENAKFIANKKWFELLEQVTNTPDLSLPVFDNLNSILKECSLTELKKAPKLIAELGRFGVKSAALDELSNLISGEIENYTNKINYISKECSRYIDEADFSFILDGEKNLLVVGYNVDESRRDNSSYDLLASEARLPSLVGVAKGELTQRHWFSLGRGLADTPGGKALLSWSGTMFEYLMPLVVMKDFQGTLLSQTYRSVIEAQRKYAAKRGVPWGISESAYSGVDLHSTYQYKAFGVPQLGLKRGLEQDVVISPYSTLLAVPISPNLAVKNLRSLEKEVAYGEYGFYEAIDYTPERLSDGEKCHVVEACFAHHQGMSLVSISNYLNNGAMQERFHKDPAIRSVEMLLHEKFPHRVALAVPHQSSFSFFEQVSEEEAGSKTRILSSAHTTFPVTHLLSNRKLSSMIDNAGSGFILFEKDVSLTRWKEDKIINDSGYYFYIRDRDSKEVWSTTYQPTRVKPDTYDVFFSADKIEFKLKKSKILAHTEVTVASEDNVEVRRITLSNLSSRKRSLELTSFAEVVLGSTRGDAAHPAFAKMFIESEFVPDLDTLILSRRPRSAKEPLLFMFHSVSSTLVWERTQFESSRAAFIGRGNNVHGPYALEAEKLSGQQGFVLDPIFSLRTRIDLEPHSFHVLSFMTGAGRTRDEVCNLASRYQDFHQVSRAFDLAWSQSSVELRNQQFPIKHTHAFQLLGNAILFSIPSLRGSEEALTKNRMTQSGLWRFGISGDLPLVVAHVNEPSQVKFVRELLHAHWYLSNRGLQFDLVILNEHPGGYFQNFQEELENLLRGGPCAGVVEKRAGVFLRTALQLSVEEVALLQSVARVVLFATNGSLDEQLSQDIIEVIDDDEGAQEQASSLAGPMLEIDHAEFTTAHGGFTNDGKSYSMVVHGDKLPPLPWSNIIANPQFGTLITECGSGYSWSENSRENRLTPWSNDPICDPPSEVIYIKDGSGSVWCPTPRPMRNALSFKIEHSQGTSIFETEALGIHSKLTLTVSPEERIKWWQLKLQNSTTETKSLDIYFYVEWVLGVLRADSARYIVTEFDKLSEALTAINRYNNEFAGRYAFIGSCLDIDGFTTDREEFIGRNRDLGTPLALFRKKGGKKTTKLSGRTGTAIDPCGILKVALTIDPSATREVTFFLGEASSLDEIRKNTPKNRSPKTCDKAIEDSTKYWNGITSALTIKTPFRSFDIMMNGWLLYQTVSCRLFGRTGFYQSGGAFGFRDQLQDVLALLISRPDLARNQILIHAKRQFIEGDVQHWWHPPTGRGVRTKISDDFLWLPYVVDRYIDATGDRSILEEQLTFIEGAQLHDQHEAYIVPHESTQKDTLYQHCILALERALAFGEHGLPLIGIGDWNDGMNEIGKDGKGESVWLAWFLAMQLERFNKFVAERDKERAKRYKKLVNTITEAIEKNAWDGKWYRRAYFDDGTPLGSATNEECKIDSISQTWGIISGLANEVRAKQALESVYEHLVKKDEKIICLLTPPFNKSSLEPGYIKGYLPGVRENGGQYTHAGVWVVIATAMLGRGTKAFELFDLMNPIMHSATNASVEQYQSEPYVMCGDVYGVKPHVGRGGWSWYSGSAGWLYQAGLEYILGIKLKGDYLEIDPCIPASWPSFHVSYQRGATNYQIEVLNPDRVERGVKEVFINGKLSENKKVNLTSLSSSSSAEACLVKIVLG